jgi:periplasmic copper chaperone A
MPSRLCALLVAAALAASSAAQQFQLGTLTINHPWSPPTVATIPVGAAYLSITNNGKVPDTLVGASSPVADSVQIHQTATVENMTRMRPLHEIEIAPGATVNAEPGGIHFMLMGLNAPLTVGKSVPLTLEFRVAGRITVELSVRPRDAATP